MIYKSICLPVLELWEEWKKERMKEGLPDSSSQVWHALSSTKVLEATCR